MNENRRKSLETIINTPDYQFITGNYFEPNTSEQERKTCKACAMGHIYRAHNILYPGNCGGFECTNKTGLNAKERTTLIHINDSEGPKGVKDYCRKLLEESC